MILAFSYYNFDETSPAFARLAAALAGELAREGFGPLDVRPPEESARLHWHAPDLLFSQTCGLPYVRGVRASAQLIATPHYDAEGCTGPEYCSMIVVRADDPVPNPAALAGRVAAVNGFDSQSGCNALFSVLPPASADAPFFSRLDITGAHTVSAARVAAGKADCAAIDAVCWAMIERLTPGVANRLRVLARSPRVPGLPFITARSHSAATLARLREALARVMADPSPDLAAARGATLLTGFSTLGDDAYDPVVHMDALVAPRVAHYRSEAAAI